MKKWMKYIALSLAVMSLALAVACKRGSESSQLENYVNVENSDFVEGMVHERTQSKTDYKLLQDGKTDYQILVSTAERDGLLEAINELQYFFREATNIRLQVVIDEGKTHDKEATYISLGTTSALTTSGINVDKATLGHQGFQIETKDRSIYIYGERKGVLWGVYDLLNVLFGYETYSNEYYSLNRNVKDLSLPALKIKEVPDIEIRYPISGSQYGNQTAAHRMRFNTESETIVAGGQSHNMLETIVPFKQYEQTHRDWFNREGTQLCYTAHGNQEEYALMLETAVANVKKLIEATPTADALSLTQMDVRSWCDCTTCKEVENYYGAKSAVQIRFVNDVVEKVSAWLEEEKNGRDVTFVIFAYHLTEKAPVKKNADGTYAPIDSSVVLNPNIAIWIAPLDEDFTLDVYDSRSKNLRDMMESWSVCASKCWVWAYTVYFNEYLIPYDSYDALPSLIRYCVQHNAQYFWAQGSYGLKQSTGFDDLKNYIAAKLMWNCNLEVGTLITDYFDNVYKEASGLMEEAFWTWRTHSLWQEQQGRSANIFTAPFEKKYWTKQYLVGQINRMEQAKTLIEKYKTSNPVLYKAIHDSIVAETVSPRYVLLKSFSSTYTPNELATLKKDFATDVNRLNFNMTGEGAKMSDFLN